MKQTKTLKLIQSLIIFSLMGNLIYTNNAWITGTLLLLLLLLINSQIFDWVYLDKKKSGDDDLLKALSKTLLVVNKTFEHELGIIEQELSRTELLANDAVIGMGESFKMLQALSSEEKSAILQLIKQNSLFDDNDRLINNFVDYSNRTLENFAEIIVKASKLNLDALTTTHELKKHVDELSKVSARLNTLEQELTTLKAEINRKGVAEFTTISESADTVLNELKRFSYEHNDVERNIFSTLATLEQRICNLAEADMNPTLITSGNVSMMMEHMKSMSRNTIKCAEQIAALSPNISDAAALGVRSLQFEDLIKQTISSLHTNVNYLRDILLEISSLTEMPKANLTSQLNKLHDKCEAIHTQSKERNKYSSIKQKSLNEGDIELF